VIVVVGSTIGVGVKIATVGAITDEVGWGGIAAVIVLAEAGVTVHAYVGGKEGVGEGIVALKANVWVGVGTGVGAIKYGSSDRLLNTS
jgi:hypothetical protein